MENNKFPKISVWITSTGRYDLVRKDIESFVKYNTYPNWQFIIFESVPTKESLKYYNTHLLKSDESIEYLKTVKNVKRLFIEPWPPWGKVCQTLLDATDTEYFINLEDDWVTIYDPREWFIEVIALLKSREELYGITGNLQRPEFNEKWPGWSHPKYSGGVVNDGKFYYGYGSLVSLGGMLSKTVVARSVGFPTDHPISAGNIKVAGNPEGQFGDRILNAGYRGGRLFNWHGWFCSQNTFSVGGYDPKGAKHVKLQAKMIEQGKVCLLYTSPSPRDS